MGMSMKARKEYLEEVKIRYLNGDRASKNKILTESALVTKMHRKSLIRYFHNNINRIVKKKKLKKRGRKSKYDYPEFKKVLKDIWFETERMCSRNLVSAIPHWLPFYESLKGQLSENIKNDLLKISHSSIDRLIHPWRSKYGKGQCGTKPGTMLKTAIPIKGEEWEANRPGFMEADTVAHCGGSLAGEFFWTFTLTDIDTQWTEIRPVWHKEAKETLEQLKSVERMLPFKIIAFNSDNGGEFINKHFLTYFMQRDRMVHFSRSRPYKKNDNAHVEQKNWTHARSLLGYSRLDNKDIMEELVKILQDWSLLKNHFFPCKKLLSKERIKSKWFKNYEKPKTPYQRLMESNYIAQNTKNNLKQIHDSLDLLLLRRDIRTRINKLFRNSSVTSNYEAPYPKRTSLR